MDDFQREMEAADAQDGEMPNGSFDVEVISAEAWTADDGRRYAKLYQRVTTGMQQGRVFEHWLRFGHPVSRRQAKETLAMYRFTPIPEWPEFVQTIVQLVGIRSNVSVSHSNGYENVKVNTASAPPTRGQTAMPTAPAAAAAPAPHTATDDDPPF